MTLDSFDAAPGHELRESLRSCCAAESWVRSIATGRPYRDETSLYARSDYATAQLDDAGLADALAAHPRIGNGSSAHEAGGQPKTFSDDEQPGVRTADSDVLAEIALANADYERRFSRIYLVCASGRTARELLSICRSRLNNDPATERAVVLNELAKINRLRLGKLLHQQESP